MPRDCLYVVAYDVTEDKERDRVADVLEGFGFRLQQSVFECRLTRTALERVRQRLEALTLATGFVAIYRADARAARRCIGVPPREQFGAYETHALVA